MSGSNGVFAFASFVFKERNSTWAARRVAVDHLLGMVLIAPPDLLDFHFQRLGVALHILLRQGCQLGLHVCGVLAGVVVHLLLHLLVLLVLVLLALYQRLKLLLPRHRIRWKSAPLAVAGLLDVRWLLTHAVFVVYLHHVDLR